MEEGETSIPEVPSNFDCSSGEAVSKIVRPGICSDTLALAGVRFSDFPEPGSIEIPYFDVNGKAIGFSRWRLPTIRPNGQKYHQKPKSGFHVYFPPCGINESPQLVIVEGEFKALSVYELGMPVIGLCGLYTYKSDEKGEKTLLAEIDQATTRSSAEKVYFIGDADTATNLHFARSAQFLADKLSPIPVLLPRLPLDGPKGFDDWKDSWNGASTIEAGMHIEALFAEALSVKPGLSFVALAEILLAVAEPQFKRLEPGEYQNQIRKLVRMAAEAQISGEPAVAIGRLARLSAKLSGSGRLEFSRSIQQYLADDGGRKCASRPVRMSPEGPMSVDRDSPRPSSIKIENDKPLLTLPCNEVEIVTAANELFARLKASLRYFVRDRTVFEAIAQPNGAILRECTPDSFRSQIEDYFNLVKIVQTAHRKPALSKCRCSLDSSKALLSADAAWQILPPVKIVTSSPIFVEVDKELRVLNKGYHAELGGILITKERTIADIDLEEAWQSLLALLKDFNFVTESDRSRAIASFISPALRLGRLLKCDFPLDLAEANESQSGKTYRQKLACAIYGEVPFVINMNEQHGVGSLDEKISDALLSGCPFLMLENVRGVLKSQLLESAIRGVGTVQARRAYSRSIQVQTDQLCWFLSSNRITSTPDLANRSIITRIRKQQTGFIFKDYPQGTLIDHVSAKADYYLSCIFAVLRDWYRYGTPRSEDMRHDFREWCQALDWIVQMEFFLPPLLDGHQCEQQRIADLGLSWLREVAASVDKLERLGEGLRATDIIEVCEATDVQIPGCNEATPSDQIPMVIGKILKRIFSTADTVEVGGYRIKRETRDEVDANRMNRSAHYHYFIRTGEASPSI
jgi:hypothetical protein